MEMDVFYAGLTNWHVRAQIASKNKTLERPNLEDSNVCSFKIGGRADKRIADAQWRMGKADGG